MASSYIYRNKIVSPSLSLALSAYFLSGFPTPFDTDDKRTTTRCEGDGGMKDDFPPKIIFLGTGSSTGCPKPLCSLLFPPDENERYKKMEHVANMQNQMARRCATSRLATAGNPKDNKNYRNNPSLLISHRNNDDDENDSNDGGLRLEQQPLKNVVIDVGKTFREGAIRWMPHHNITSLDAIVLTHEHMDAVGGLDDVRGFQRTPRFTHSSTSPSPSSSSTPSSSSSAISVYLSSQCYAAIEQQFHYLTPPKKKERVSATDNVTTFEKKSRPPVVTRAVASLDYRIIKPFVPFVAAGLRIVPLPVMHGEDFVSLGFAFSIKTPTRGSGSCSSSSAVKENDDDGGGTTTSGTMRTMNVVYLSDISRMLPETQRYILESLPPTDILVVDSLLRSGKHNVHFNLEEALDLARVLKARKTFIVGINCDDFPDHDVMNGILKDLDIDVQLAHDGLALELEL